MILLDIITATAVVLMYFCRFVYLEKPAIIAILGTGFAT